MTRSLIDRRRSIALIVCAVPLIAAACGGRETAEPTTAAPASPATTAAAPAGTTSAPVTTAAPATTAAAPQTTLSPLFTAVAGFTGDWNGEWVNTTFGSRGPMLMILEVVDDESFSVIADLDGSVFGQGDPGEERWIFNIAELTGPVTVQSSTFGEITLILSLEGARITAADVPAPGIASFQLDAAFEVGPRIVGTYLVGFDDGTVAEGTAQLQRIDP